MNEQLPAQLNTQPIDMEKAVDLFVRLRDMKAELEAAHKEKVKPLTDKMDNLKDQMRSAILAAGAENMKTAAGTVSLLNKVSASAADINAFWTWVVTQGAFDMLDKKPNVTAITEYVQANGVPPPGVNYNTFIDVGVRRK